MWLSLAGLMTFSPVRDVQKFSLYLCIVLFDPIVLEDPRAACFRPCIQYIWVFLKTKLFLFVLAVCMHANSVLGP